MAEEFFRGSFTTGIWAQGEIVPGLYYSSGYDDGSDQTQRRQRRPACFDEDLGTS